MILSLFAIARLNLICVGSFLEPISTTDCYILLADVDDISSGGLRKSDTIWLDPHVSSMVRVVNRRLTRDARTYVERIEYLTELPSLMPVPRIRTAFVIDCSDPKFNIYDEHGDLLSVEVLAKGQVSAIFRESC
jgi:hypothetical protein